MDFIIAADQPILQDPGLKTVADNDLRKLDQNKLTCKENYSY